MSTPDHYPLGFSSARRWMRCPGSVRLQSAYPNEDSIHSREGTAAHWHKAEYQQGIYYDAGQLAPNGVEITDEMIAGSELAHDYIDEQRRSRNDNKLATEVQVTASIIHPQCGGTPDDVITAPFEVHVFDYKFGYRPVEAFENWQLILAALAAAPWTAETRYHLHIIQPRAFHREGPIRSWSISGAELNQYVAPLRQGAAEVFNPGAELRPSSECHHCLARHACPALQNTATSVIDLTTMAVPFNLTDAQMGTELRWLAAAQDRLKARISGLEAEVEARLRAGRSVPHWGLESTVPRLDWTVPPEQVVALGTLADIDLRKPGAVVTPTQAKKAGLDPTLVDALSARPKGTMKLTPVTTEFSRKVFQ
jgi:hypothetical protein